MQNPKVSVAMLTYNHERFVAQAVESALAQQTSFAFEIVIGDDASQDSTRSILLELQRKHPKQIRLLLHEQNLTGLRNLEQVLGACRGDYIAILEGDDYWTDSVKLQKQADRLDADPGLAICHTNALKVYDGEKSPSKVWHEVSPPQRATLDDLLRWNIIVTCTVMFRNHLFQPLPNWFFEGRIGDWPLHMLNALHGDIDYIDEVTAAYRIHAGGFWSTRSRLDEIAGLVCTAQLMRTALPPKHQKQLDRTINQWHAEVVDLKICNGEFDEAQQYAIEKMQHPGAYDRLVHFYRGLEFETANQRGKACGQFLRSILAGQHHSRIRLVDLFVAITRTSFPRSYSISRRTWRWLSRNQTA